jgi:hypothetical protein
MIGMAWAKERAKVARLQIFLLKLARMEVGSPQIFGFDYL